MSSVWINNDSPRSVDRPYEHTMKPGTFSKTVGLTSLKKNQVSSNCLEILVHKRVIVVTFGTVSASLGSNYESNRNQHQTR